MAVRGAAGSRDGEVGRVRFLRPCGARAPGSSAPGHRSGCEMGADPEAVAADDTCGSRWSGQRGMTAPHNPAECGSAAQSRLPDTTVPGQMM